MRPPGEGTERKERVQRRVQRTEESGTGFKEWFMRLAVSTGTPGTDPSPGECPAWINPQPIVKGLASGAQETLKHPEEKGKRRSLRLTKDNVQVLFHPLNEEVVHRKGRDFHLPTLLGPGCHLHLLHQVGLLVSSEDVGHVARVQEHVDVFDEGLILDLAVTEEEHGALGGHAHLQHDLLQVLAPLAARVALGDLNLVQLVGVDERGQFAGALPPAAPDAHQEQVAFVLLQDPADSGHVLDGEPEHDQGHGGLADVVELFQVVLHDHRQLFQVSDLIIDFGVTFWFEVIAKEEATNVVFDDLSRGRQVDEDLWDRGVSGRMAARGLAEGAGDGLVSFEHVLQSLGSLTVGENQKPEP